jgi:hypothetical protein
MVTLANGSEGEKEVLPEGICCVVRLCSGSERPTQIACVGRRPLTNATPGGLIFADHPN